MPNRMRIAPTFLVCLLFLAVFATADGVESARPRLRVRSTDLLALESGSDAGGEVEPLQPISIVGARNVWSCRSG